MQSQEPAVAEEHLDKTETSYLVSTFGTHELARRSIFLVDV